jgi:hypothetical protein
LILRALLLATALVAVGCGDDTTSAGVSTDMSQPILDLTDNAPHCGASICTMPCSACAPLGGGVCVQPCMVADPNSCNAPLMCKPVGSDPDAGGSVTLVGNCTGTGYDGYCG